MASHFKLLGLRNNASAGEATKNYRRLALDWHPDKNPGHEKMATEKMKELNEAYSKVMEKLQGTSTYQTPLPTPEATFEHAMPRPDHVEIPSEKPDELTFECLSQLCDNYISKIPAAKDRSSKLLKYYRQDRKQKGRKPMIFHMIKIKSKTAGFLAHAQNWRSWLDARKARTSGSEEWWEGFEALRQVREDLFIKLDAINYFNSELDELIIEDSKNPLSEDQWRFEAFKVKELATWVSTIKVS